MQNFYSLTPSEQYRINGTLSAETIESLLDNAEAVSKAEGVSARVSEAIGSLPSEDFLSDFIADLYALSKRLRGDNKTDALSLLDKAESLKTELQQMAEYAEDELCKARTELEEIGL